MLLDEYKFTVFHEIYKPETLDKIAERAKCDKGIHVLISKLKGDNEYLKIGRVHLDKCLRFAKRNGGLDADRIQRLTDPGSYHVWQAVYNEISVPYFFSNVLD